MDQALERIGDLDTWKVRRTACARRLGSLEPNEALANLEALFIEARHGKNAAVRTALAFAMWMVRADMPPIRSEGRTLRARPDSTLEALRSSASRDATPLAFHVLVQPRVEPTSRSWWAAGMAVDVPRMFCKPDPLRRGSPPVRAIQLGGDSAWRKMSVLLDTPTVDPALVLRLTTSRRLPAELAYAIAVRDRWIARPDIREALVLSRTAPAALVAALLPTASGRVLRVAAERHAGTALGPASEAFLAHGATDGDCEAEPPQRQ